MILWVNGAFGSGKTTLTEVLLKRMPEAVLFDPEYIGYCIKEWVPVPTGDFQDLPIWRHLVIDVALALRKFHADVLIVPMTLVVGQYYQEVVSGLRDAGEAVVHVFLDVPRMSCGSASTSRYCTREAPNWTPRRVPSGSRTLTAAWRPLSTSQPTRSCSALTSSALIS